MLHKFANKKRNIIKMKNLIIILSLITSAPVFGWKKKPATVIITAGQSNTDGRVLNEYLPDYIKNEPYKHCKWNYSSVDKKNTGHFELFYPRIINKNKPGRWAYDAVTYYWLEQALEKDFYVIKTSLGVTAINLSSKSTGGKYWSADKDWLSENKATTDGGKSLLLSFTENINTSIDSTLSKLPEGYDIKAFLWHQGESDCNRGDSYYNNLKQVIEYVRNFLYLKTGNKKYKKLPFICGTISHKNKRYDKNVENAMYRLANEDNNVFVIDMSDGELQRDELHFTEKSAEYLGVEMYNKLVELGIAGKKAKKQ